MTNNSKWTWRTLTLLYLGALGYLCFAPPGAFPTVTNWNFFIPADKLVHFCMFAPLPVLLFMSFKRKWNRVGQSYLAVLIIFLCGVLVAGSTEIIQGLSPCRSQELGDFIADSTGMAISCLLLILYQKKTFGKSRTR